MNKSVKKSLRIIYIFSSCLLIFIYVMLVAFSYSGFFGTSLYGIITVLFLYSVIRIWKVNGIKLLPLYVFIITVLMYLIYIKFIVGHGDWLHIFSYIIGCSGLAGYECIQYNWLKNNIDDEVEKKIIFNRVIGILKGCLLTVLIIIGVIVLCLVTYKIVESIPKIIDNKTNDIYEVELYAKGSPIWPFGPQDGKVVLSNQSGKIYEVDFTLHNDGKIMDESNWKVDWKEDRVIVTIIGEEQSDQNIVMYYED